MLLFAIGCAAGIPHPTEAQVGRAQGRWPATSLASLEQGRDLYLRRCSGCHTPIAPAARAAGDWPGLVEEMAERAKLGDDEQTLVVRYLVTAAEK
jgi:mono/diheme cytochrome c family protein